MTIPTEKLRAIEARTEHAVVHTLRLMAQEIVTLCSQPASADRGDAGMSLLKVEGLDRARGTVPAGESDLTVFAMPTPNVAPRFKTKSIPSTAFTVPSSV